MVNSTSGCSACTGEEHKSTSSVLPLLQLLKTGERSLSKNTVVLIGSVYTCDWGTLIGYAGVLQQGTLCNR